VWGVANGPWAGSRVINPLAKIGNPIKDGTMTLIDRDHAHFDVLRDPSDSALFPGNHIRFIQGPDSKILPGLCD